LQFLKSITTTLVYTKHCYNSQKGWEQKTWVRIISHICFTSHYLTITGVPLITDCDSEFLNPFKKIYVSLSGSHIAQAYSRWGHTWTDIMEMCGPIKGWVFSTCWGVDWEWRYILQGQSALSCMRLSLYSQQHWVLLQVFSIKPVRHFIS